ncbi:blue (type 1) copper domain-containing protein [groundwater metagenome]
MRETFLSKETITNICDSMKKLFPIIMVLLIVALSGCTGQDATSETEGQTFERVNLNLDGKIMDIKLSPTDARAGEKITAKLVLGNTGTENIVNETIEIKAKAKSLEDFFANLALVAMSDEKKTMSFSMNYDEEIKPGMIKPLTHVFSTPGELKGRNLAGTYDITVILSVNGQKVESKSIKLKLHSGKPRDGSNIPVNTPSDTVSATPTPTVTVTAAPAMTVTATPTPTPTPAPTPEAVTVEPTGKTIVTRIMGYKFGEPSISIDAGDTLQWYNLDDDTMTLSEINGKIPNQSVYSRRNYIFNTTGTYTFHLFYSKMRVSPPVQVITVKLNQSQ